MAKYLEEMVDAGVSMALPLNISHVNYHLVTSNTNNCKPKKEGEFCGFATRVSFFHEEINPLHKEYNPVKSHTLLVLKFCFGFFHLTCIVIITTPNYSRK